ncbi:MAG TPA: hypothetical protein VFS86_05210 [Rhodanobacteraceae bacterium]|jgi:hypothetical protein|nr:hypothetical protein [Rhodanobacteraceae bacterium]
MLNAGVAVSARRATMVGSRRNGIQATMGQPTAKAAAEAVRNACLQAALDGYERAGMGGLCEEGRWEMVVDAIRSLDVERVLAGLRESPEATGHPAAGGRRSG